MISWEEDRAQFANETVNQSFNYLEGWTDSTGRLYARRDIITTDNLPGVFSNSQNIHKGDDTHTCRFRVLSIPQPKHAPMAPVKLKIGTPKCTFYDIKENWHLHDLTLEAFMENNGVLMRFDSQQQQCLLTKVAISRAVGFDAVSISHLHSQNLTNVLYCNLWEKDQDEIFEKLLVNPERCLQPAYFAAVLYGSHYRRLEQFRCRVDDEITSIEGGTKFGGPGRLFGQRFWYEEREKEVNVENTNKKLSYVQSELAVAQHLARSVLLCGKWLVEVAEKDHVQWEKSQDVIVAKEVRGDLEVTMKDNTRKTADEIIYVKRRAEAMGSQLQSLSDRVGSQTTFLLNTETQNQANYTATIAVEARRDSAAMKTIAILTIVFLPGTFVASLFSTDMFDWNTENGSIPKVSKYIWIYWVVTVPLTLLVMITWAVWSKKDFAKRRREDGKIYSEK